MFKNILLLFIFFFVSCSSESYYLKSFSYNEPISVTTGSRMLFIEQGKYSFQHDRKFDTFRQELIYNGMASNVLSIMYREYYGIDKSVYIRNDFTQTLQYDLSKSKIISFRSIRLEILDVGTEEITFKILSWADEPKNKNTIEIKRK